MDEVLFRSSQKLENLQVQLSLAASYSKDLLQQYSQQSKSVILQAWNGPHSAQIKTSLKEFWQYIVNLGVKVQDKMLSQLDPEKLYYNLVKVLCKKWTKRDFCFVCVGFVCGSVAGAIFAFSLKKRERIIRYMQAVQCLNYLGVESASAVADARAPSECGEDEVIINVQAGSVHVIDAQICQGYGKTLRRILQGLYNKRSNNGLPVTLGRDCTGIITDIGPAVKRLEVGDEVWVTVPFWCEGTLSQSVLVPEYRVGRKPKNVGFEGACSLPYAGSLALSALKELGVSQENAQDKRFLIIGGTTPVGCVLIQILKHWEASVVATCSKRAVPVAEALGVNETVCSPEAVIRNETTVLSLESPEESLNTFQKEIELKGQFDFIIITKSCALKNLDNFCSGKIISTLPPSRLSDSCGFLAGLIISCYVRVKYLFEKFLRIPLNDFDEAHLCYITLDELADLVESGVLQTVVDKVYHPQDIEIALNHIQSPISIGSTVITFR